MARFGANTTEHVFEIELHIILATLDNFDHWNWTLLITKCHYLNKNKSSQVKPVHFSLAMVGFS